MWGALCKSLYSPTMERRSKAARKTVESLCCKCRKRTKAGIHSPALLLFLLYKLGRKKYNKKRGHWKKCILSRMQREGFIGSLIQPMGYVNKQFALQRDDMTKELWRQNWISFDRMWLPLSLIDFHHRHMAEAFTTWNWEESAAIERKWQSNTNNGGFIKNLFSSLSLYQMSLHFIYGQLCNTCLLKSVYGSGQ